MVVYFFGENIFICVIYAICTVIFAAVSFVVIGYLIKKINVYRQSGLKFPAFLYCVFVLIALVPMIGVGGFGKKFIQTVSFNSDMKNGDALYLVGEVELLSSESVDYRGDYLGYAVEISVDGEIIAPCNTFSEEVLEYFSNNEYLIIQYGTIEGDGIYVWSIKTALSP